MDPISALSPALSASAPRQYSPVTTKEEEAKGNDPMSSLFEDTGSPEVGATEEQASYGLSMARQLTDEEEKRLAELQDQLLKLLADAVDNPSEETKRRIREVEEEIGELTGIRFKRRLAETVKKMPGQDEDEDKEPGLYHMPGHLALELGLRPVPTDRADPKGIMSFYQQNLAPFLAVGIGNTEL